ncbi:hypothetical protein DWQ65_05530 [Treponema phagedenis]|nr:hypothetical protein C5O78_02700 [Treponema phagedenis]QSH99529.1 hypothetical protein DWQ65_05530 [Treponema phagedenis]
MKEYTIHSWALRFERNTSGFTMGTAGKKHVQTAASFRAPLTLRLFCVGTLPPQNEQRAHC